VKKYWLVAVSLALALAIVGLVGCSPESNTPTEITGLNVSTQQQGIWVTGQGKVTVVPDIAILRLGIEAQDTSVAEAQIQAAEAMDEVMTALTENGVAKNDIQTQYFNIHRVTRWDRDTEQEVTLGYRVVNTVTVKIRDIDDTGTVIDAVAKAGGDLTRIDSISFSVDDPSDYYEEARKKAMADAKAKAEQLADLADVDLSKPTYISEGIQTPTPRYFQGFAYDEAVPAPTVETSISPGEMEITLNIQVVYAIR